MTFWLKDDIIESMVRKKVKGKKFYYVQCGDWESVTVASTPREACKEAASQAIERFGNDIKTTKVIICCDCSMLMEDSNESVEAFLIEKIMEDIYEH